MKPGTKQQGCAGVSGRQRKDRPPEGIPSCRRKYTNNTFFARKFNPQAMRLYSQFCSVQLLSHVQLFVIPWTAARQASLSITNSQSLLKLMFIELMMPSNHLILCCPFFSCLQSFPASGSFLVSQFFASGGQSIGVSASASVLPMNIQD